MTTILTIAVVYTAALFLAKNLMLKMEGAPCDSINAVADFEEKIERFFHRLAGVLTGALVLCGTSLLDPLFSVIVACGVGGCMGTLAAAATSAFRHRRTMKAQINAHILHHTELLVDR